VSETDGASRHVPYRTCVGCRGKASAAEMHRIAAALDGTLDVGRDAAGRGAWVCDARCFDLAVRRHAFERALRRPLSKAEIQGVRATLFEIS
jgi:predicted RNA-binding protein YlxR (DUF448 family)